MTSRSVGSPRTRYGAARLLVLCSVAAAVVLWIRAVRLVEAHELSETSATLVLRDGGHVELRLQVPWAQVLREQWVPGVTMEEFLVRVGNQRPAEFARELTQVENGIERSTRFVIDGGAPAALSNWQWPAAAVVQEALRRELMSRLADGDRFEHASRLPALAEQTVGREPASVRFQLPVALGPALLTVYRPTEQWLKPGEVSAPISVRRSTAP